MIVAPHHSAFIYEEGALSGLAILSRHCYGFELIARQCDFNVVAILFEEGLIHQLLFDQLIERTVFTFSRSCLVGALGAENHLQGAHRNSFIHLRRRILGRGRNPGNHREDQVLGQMQLVLRPQTIV